MSTECLEGFAKLTRNRTNACKMVRSLDAMKSSRARADSVPVWYRSISTGLLV